MPITCQRVIHNRELRSTGDRRQNAIQIEPSELVSIAQFGTARYIIIKNSVSSGESEAFALQIIDDSGEQCSHADTVILFASTLWTVHARRKYPKKECCRKLFTLFFLGRSDIAWSANAVCRRVGCNRCASVVCSQYEREKKTYSRSKSNRGTRTQWHEQHETEEEAGEKSGVCLMTAYARTQSSMFVDLCSAFSTFQNAHISSLLCPYERCTWLLLFAVVVRGQTAFYNISQRIRTSRIHYTIK